MSSLVTKLSPPVLIRPSEPTPAGIITLASADMSHVCVPFASFHVFDRPIPNPAQTIRRALSHALVHYYPVAGRLFLGAGGDRDVRIACTGDGVAFVPATASCTLEHARFLHAPPLIPPGDLAIPYGGRCRLSDPLMTVQVTEFACGGYVVGATWNHGVADGVGMAQLLGAVGELARGLPRPSVAPVRSVTGDGSLPEIPQLLTSIRSQFAGAKHVDFAHTDVTVPWSFIKRVKADYGARAAAGDEPCSTFEAVTAAVWRCRTRAIGAGAGSPALLMYAANVRKQAGAKAGYYGNCITYQLVAAAAGAVADGDVVDLMRQIKRAKEQIRKTLRSKVEQLTVGLDEEVVAAMSGYRAMLVSSWRGLGMDGVDFGGGTPARVVCNMETTILPMCFPCMPCARNDADGVNVIAFCVTRDHAQRFHTELARLQ